MKLPLDFYQRDEVCTIARELLGKILVTHLEEETCKAIITETEAYNGRTDKACHAFGGLRTKRTEVMYAAGGVAYVYLCYGIHQLFNVVTNKEGFADAVLIRACEPLEGVQTMLRRRGLQTMNKRLTSGPGSLSKAMGISLAQNGANLRSESTWIEDRPSPPKDEIVETTRIGVDYAGDDALLPWRYYMKNNIWISKN